MSTGLPWQSALVLAPEGVASDFTRVLTSARGCEAPAVEEVVAAQERYFGVERATITGRHRRWILLSVRDDCLPERRVRAEEALRGGVDLVLVVLDADGQSVASLRTSLERFASCWPAPHVVLRGEERAQLERRERETRAALEAIAPSWRECSFHVVPGGGVERGRDAPHGAIASYARWLDALEADESLPSSPENNESLPSSADADERSFLGLESRCLSCASCSAWLAGGLFALERLSPTEVPYHRTLLPPGFYAVSDGTYAPRGWIVTDVADSVFIEYRTAASFGGCCGYLPLSPDAYNIMCRNGHPVGNGYSECADFRRYTFDPSKVVLR